MKRSFALKALTAALILASSTTFAGSHRSYKGDFKGEVCPPPAMLKTGWYLGGQVGYDSYRVRNSVQTPGASALTANPVLSANGWVGGVMLGYGMMMNEWFYGGLEIFGNWSSADASFSTADTSTYTNRFEANTSYGIGILPGAKLTDSTLTYLRLGWNWANVKTKETVTGSSGANKSNTSNGFVFGFGMETLLMDNWSLRGEYDHMWYSDYNTNSTYGTRVDPSDNQFLASLIYHFDL